MAKMIVIVENFKKLYAACEKEGRQLIYITDGIGWLGLKGTIESVVRLDVEGRRAHPDRKIPFLMNIQLFDEWLSRIKSTFK